jgi:hypothetical protein
VTLRRLSVVHPSFAQCHPVLPIVPLAATDAVMNAASTGAVARALPSWLHDVLLGYGDPAAAHYASLPRALRIDDVDFGDTFLSPEHVAASFPGKQVEFRDEATGAALDPAADPAATRPPYRVRFEQLPGGRGSGGSSGSSSAPSERVVIFPYRAPSPGPYPEDVPRRNGVAFTPVQVEAIRSGVNRGLTMVVGPPGTGKTDVAVQIISTLYHNFPNQVRTGAAKRGVRCRSFADMTSYPASRLAFHISPASCCSAC